MLLEQASPMIKLLVKQESDAIPESQHLDAYIPVWFCMGESRDYIANM